MKKNKRFFWLLLTLFLFIFILPASQESIQAKPLGVVLNVPPVVQFYSPPEGDDIGAYHCLAASTTMVLQYFRNIGKIPASSKVDYPSIRKEFGPVDPITGGFSYDKSEYTIKKLSNDYLIGTTNTSNENNAINSLNNEVNHGFPVIVHVIDANKLISAIKEGLPFTMPHAIVVKGTNNVSITYIDPWNGKTYSQKNADFLKAWSPPYYYLTTRIIKDNSSTVVPTQPPINTNCGNCSCIDYVMKTLFGSRRSGGYPNPPSMDSDRFWSQSDVNPKRRITDNPKPGDVIIFHPEATFYILNYQTNKWSMITQVGEGVGHIGIITSVVREPGFWYLDIRHANWWGNTQILNKTYRCESGCSGVGDSRVKIPDHQPVHFWTPVDTLPTQPAPPVPSEQPTEPAQPTQPPVVIQNGPPNPPQLTSPDNLFETQDPHAMLCAVSKGDPDGDNMNEFYYEIFDSAQLWNSGWVNDSCVRTDLLGEFTYKWHVKVRDSRNAESAWSDERIFSIQPAIPEPTAPQESENNTETVPCFEEPSNNCNLGPGIPAAVLIKPPNNKYFNVGDAINFVWEPVPSAIEYQVYYGQVDNPGKALSWTNKTKYPLGVVEESDRCKTYWWQVNARNEGAISQSEVWYFFIKCLDVESIPLQEEAPGGFQVPDELPGDNCGFVGCH